MVARYLGSIAPDLRQVTREHPWSCAILADIARNLRTIADQHRRVGRDFRKIAGDLRKLPLDLPKPAGDSEKVTRE
jgi:hypothetical protein